MSKAVLILDMPKSCAECPCFFEAYTDMSCQALNNRTIDYPYPKDFRQHWCPLKMMPEEDDREYVADWTRGYAKGWNDCIRAISE